MQIKELVDKSIDVLRDIGLVENTLNSLYSSEFKPIINFYEERGFKEFDDDLNNLIIEHYYNQLKDGDIAKYTYNKRIRGINIIKEIHDTGSYLWKATKKNKPVVVNVYTSLIEKHLSKRKISQKKISVEKKYLIEFSLFCINNGAASPELITSILVLNFVKLRCFTFNNRMDNFLVCLSKFLLFLFENNYTKNNLSTIVKINTNSNRKIKKPFDNDILVKLTNSIDRSKPEGKRDYAIIVLAAYTGLRSCDIVNLKLSNIDWKNKKINIIQSKTSVELSLTLSKEVCDIIADYIINGRPKTKDENVFIRCLAPFTKFNDGVSLNCIIKRRLKDIGIKRCSGDGLTIHGIRRMIGTEMVKHSIPITTVAQLLGQKSISSTKQYISLDVDGLKNCALSFDDLKGGSL